jgi:hypothetical protein
MGYGQATIGTATTLFIAANEKRMSVIITNQGASTAYVGPDALLSATNAISISSGSNLTEDSGGDRLYLGPYYAISDLSSDLRYWERTRY